MSDPHGSPSHGSSSPQHHEPEEDALRTPGWIPFVGLALLLAGALGVYLFISPGVMNPSSTTTSSDGGADAAVTDAATPQTR